MHSEPNWHGLRDSFFFSFFLAACPPPHLSTDLAALLLLSVRCVALSTAIGAPPITPLSPMSPLSEKDDALVRLPLTPLSVYSTSSAGTVIPSSMHNGQRSRIILSSLFDFSSPFARSECSPLSTTSPSAVGFFFFFFFLFSCALDDCDKHVSQTNTGTPQV